MSAELTRFLLALDGVRMGPRLAGALGGAAGPCHVLDAKYEPGSKAVVLYEHDGRLVRGDVLVDGAEPAGETLVEPGVQLSVFPVDPGLPTLPRATDPVALAAALGLPAVRVTLLRYRPGKRATMRISSSTRRRPTVIGSTVTGSTVIGKVYHDEHKAAAVASEAAARAGATPRPDHLRLAPTLAHLTELRLVVQGTMAGTPLGDLVGHARGPFPGAADGVRRAARGLVELHEGPVVSARERPVRKELLRFRARAERIATVERRTGAVLGALAERLLVLEPGLPPTTTGLVHGDCKPSQFLLRPDGAVTLLDLDHLGTSDQAGDVGTFVATLAQLAVRRRSAERDPARDRDTGELERAFIDTYLEHRAVPGLRARIEWHTAVALERKALRAFARAPRSPLAAALAGEGHRRLDSLLGAAA